MKNSYKAEITALKAKKVYNRHNIFKRANFLVRTCQEYNLSDALKRVWKEVKKYHAIIDQRIEGVKSKAKFDESPFIHPDIIMKQNYKPGKNYNK